MVAEGPLADSHPDRSRGGTGGTASGGTGGNAAGLPPALPDVDGAAVPLWRPGVATLVVLLPYAFSPVCTDEVGALDEIQDDLGARRARALVVSCDAAPTLREWRERLGTPLTLLSDFWPHGALARALGGFDERHGTARRLTVLLDGAGREVWRVQSPGGVAREVSEYLGALDLAGHRP